MRELDQDTIICRCEEVTVADIEAAFAAGARTLKAVKQVTRAGMGDCQGKTCQRLVAQVLARLLGCRPADLPPDTARVPVFPTPLGELSDE